MATTDLNKDFDDEHEIHGFMEVRNRSFKVGQTLIIHGTPGEDATRISINVGHDFNNLGLHLNPRWDDCQVLMNSREGGEWNASPTRTTNLGPFKHGKQFKASITFTKNEFQIEIVGHGEKYTFPNRHGEEEFRYMCFVGKVDVTLVNVLY